MSQIAFTISDQSLTYLGRDLVPVTIHADHMNFDEIADMLQSGLASHDDLDRLANRRKAAEAFGEGHVKIVGDVVYFDGQPLHNALTDRMLRIMAEGGNVDPLTAFLENLMRNPSAQATEELYLWLEASQLPITDDGHFVAYKLVRLDYKDIHSGSFDNSIGQIVSMPRNQVDDRRRNTCSRGLHFCSFGYLPHYGSIGNRRIMVLKINPADVVSIPEDYGNAKGRAWRYEVIGEVSEDDALTFFRETVLNTKPSASATSEQSFDDTFMIDGDEFTADEIRDAWVQAEMIDDDAAIEETLDALGVYNDGRNELIDALVQLDELDADAAADLRSAPASDDLPTLLDVAVANGAALAAEEATIDPRTVSFKHNGRDINGATVLATVQAEGGIRPAGRALNVPESTLRGWLKALGV